MFKPSPAWMQPLEPVPGVKVTHRIHLKVWRIQTGQGIVVVSFDWQSGEMVASLAEGQTE